MAVVQGKYCGLNYEEPICREQQCVYCMNKITPEQLAEQIENGEKFTHLIREHIKMTTKHDHNWKRNPRGTYSCTICGALALPVPLSAASPKTKGRGKIAGVLAVIIMLIGTLIKLATSQ